jgi:ubiquinone/menaquinone biosynthesis C-methylase UbiE
MTAASRIKEVYVDGYARMDMLRSEDRLLKVLRLAEQLIPKNPGTRVLDVGCGDGVFALELGKILGTKEVFGVDISPNAVSAARNNHVSAEVLDLDEGDLPFELDYFDLVFCGSLIQLVLDPDHLLQELHRALSRTGYLILTFPNICAWVSRLAVILGFHPYYDRVSTKHDLGKMFRPTTRGDSTGFIRLYTLRSFEELAKIYGLKMVKCVGAREAEMAGIAGLVDGVFSQFPSLAPQIICVLVK